MTSVRRSGCERNETKKCQRRRCWCAEPWRERHCRRAYNEIWAICRTCNIGFYWMSEQIEKFNNFDTEKRIVWTWENLSSPHTHPHHTKRMTTVEHSSLLVGFCVFSSGCLQSVPAFLFTRTHHSPVERSLVVKVSSTTHTTQRVLAEKSVALIEYIVVFGHLSHALTLFGVSTKRDALLSPFHSHTKTLCEWTENRKTSLFSSSCEPREPCEKPAKNDRNSPKIDFPFHKISIGKVRSNRTLISSGKCQPLPLAVCLHCHRCRQRRQLSCVFMRLVNGQ